MLTTAQAKAVLDQFANTINAKGDMDYIGGNTPEKRTAAFAGVAIGEGKFRRQIDIQKRLLSDPKAVKKEYYDIKEACFTLAKGSYEDTIKLLEQVSGEGPEAARSHAKDIFEVHKNKLFAILDDIYHDVRDVSIPYYPAAAAAAAPKQGAPAANGGQGQEVIQ